jgi:hypothetical protein
VKTSVYDCAADSFRFVLIQGDGKRSPGVARTTDWRSPEAADALKDLDRSALAWEFLRRNPEFREHFTSILERIGASDLSEDDAATELSNRWGCLVLHDPSLPADSSSPIVWSPEVLALGVTLVAGTDRYPGAHELSASDVDDARVDLMRADGRHVVLPDAESDHNLWLPEVRIGDRLAGLVVLDDNFGLRIVALQRFWRRLARRSPGPPPKAWRITRRHRWRLTLMLRALDGHLDQASYRQIAGALFGPEAVARYAWKTSSIRGQTIRLVKDALAMMNGGYRQLLAGD